MAQTIPDLLDRVRARCVALPEVAEQKAWIGERWQVRKRTFAHIFTVEPEDSSAMMPPHYAHTEVTVLSFRVLDEDVDAMKHAGPPFWQSDWGRNAFAMSLGGNTDWVEVNELLTDSYCHMAPRFLAQRVCG